MASHLPRLENLNSLSDLYRDHSAFVNAGLLYAIFVVSAILFFKDYLPPRRRHVFGLPPGTSNISDEFEYSKDQKPGQDFKVKSLWIYPIKGCRGIEVQSSKICHTG